MPWSLSRWTGACGQSLVWGCWLGSLRTMGLREKLPGPAGKYSSMSRSQGHMERFWKEKSDATRGVLLELAKRVECGELAPAFRAPSGVGASNSAGKPDALHTLRAAWRRRAYSRSVWSAVSSLPLFGHRRVWGPLTAPASRTRSIRLAGLEGCGRTRDA